MQKLTQLKEKIKKNKALIGLLSIGAVVGIVGSATFTTALEYTNTERFCIGCHEMHDTPYTEYKETVHASNRTGVTAPCAAHRRPGPCCILATFTIVTRNKTFRRFSHQYNA